MKTTTLPEKLKDIQLLLLDVDGVLTDGGIIYSDEASETKVFNVKDGLGLKLIMDAGIKPRPSLTLKTLVSLGLIPASIISFKPRPSEHQKPFITAAATLESDISGTVSGIRVGCWIRSSPKLESTPTTRPLSAMIFLTFS